MSIYPVLWHQTSYGYDGDMNPIRQRDSYLYITEQGAIEGWQAPYLHPKPGAEYFGGIEIHSKAPLYDDQQPHPKPCQWTRGVCYHDGSSLAYDRISPYFDSPTLVFAELAEWAESSFPETVHASPAPANEKETK